MEHMFLLRICEKNAEKIFVIVIILYLFFRNACKYIHFLNFSADETKKQKTSKCTQIR